MESWKQSFLPHSLQATHDDIQVLYDLFLLVIAQSRQVTNWPDNQVTQCLNHSLIRMDGELMRHCSTLEIHIWIYHWTLNDTQNKSQQRCEARLPTIGNHLEIHGGNDCLVRMGCVTIYSLDGSSLGLAENLYRQMI